MGVGYLRERKIIFLLSAAVITGSVIGFITSVYFIVSNRYIQYEMYRMAAFVFQENMNYSILLALGVVGGLYILWFLLAEKIGFNKTKIEYFYKLIIVIFFTGMVTDLLLRIFVDIPLLYGLKDLLRISHRFLLGPMTFRKSFETVNSFLSGYIILICIGAIAVPFIYRLLKRSPVENLSNWVQKQYFVHSAFALGFFILVLNLSIVIDRKINTQDGPNVIFIVVDALRADHISSYGYERLTSPNIDGLISDGIVFENAISQGNMTTLSMPSMFTGLYTSDHGAHMLRKIETRFAPVSDRFATIAEVFKNAGYITQAVSCQPWVSPETGYGQGFDNFEIVSDSSNNLSDQITVERALEWIDKESGKKFFLFLNLMGPHTPYNPPQPYDTLYSQEYKHKSKMISDLNNFYLQQNHGEYYKLLMDIDRKNVSKEEVNQLLSLYDGKITFTDYQIGRLLDKLKALNIYDNTMIVLTADHGEAFLEHGMFLHGRSLFNEELHVPLVMTYQEKLPKGKKVKNIVELVDILPTVANITGISLSGIKMRGVPLYPMTNISDHFAYSEGSGHVKYRTDKWSLICDSGDWSCELYDLENDRNELNNIIENNHSIALEMKKGLLKVVDNKMYPSISTVKTRMIPEETQKTLKSLGYLH